VLSSVALVLSLAGIYAVLSFTVARRTREIGVRVALGASRQRVVVAIFRRPLLQVALGIVADTAIIFTLATMIKYTEFPGSESDLTLQAMAMIIGYGIVMLGVCMLGCVVPTRRALNIEPTMVLIVPPLYAAQRWQGYNITVLRGRDYRPLGQPPALSSTLHNSASRRPSE
jgi:ABC-type antimicrobial peptide transport system permease subunit